MGVLFSISGSSGRKVIACRTPGVFPSRAAFWGFLCERSALRFFSFVFYFRLGGSMSDHVRDQRYAKKRKGVLGCSAALLISIAPFFFVALLGSPTAQAAPLTGIRAFPAFARKYGLPCSACHEAWPKLNAFGQTFKDNGYQLMNDRDAPIWQQPTYWPVAFRITPSWHRESVNRNAIDDPSDPSNVLEKKTTTHGFDLSGLDILTGGTLANNISFLLVPSIEGSGSGVGFESAFVRFDNLLHSPWLNVKVGKFELDNLLSEKRGLTLSDQGGGYQLYHFLPVGDTNIFGLGDNQIGAELMGHSANDRTRYSIAMLSSNDGNVGVPNGHGYDTYITASQAFQAGSFGLQRVGAFAYIGRSPTYYETQGGAQLDGLGQKSFYRAGFIGMWYVKKFDITTLFMHGSESAFLGTGTAANDPNGLPFGARSPQWNGALFESHYTVNPQLILINRYEFIRMSQQALPGNPGDLGDIDSLVFGYRYYPFMHSRAGFAFHNEYAIVRQRKVAPVTGLDVTSSSLFLGFDFIY
jgi:hypothetical protein